MKVPRDNGGFGGTASCWTLVAYKVTVPAGSFDAALIRWDHKGSGGPADIKETLYGFIGRAPAWWR